MTDFVHCVASLLVIAGLGGALSAQSSFSTWNQPRSSGIHSGYSGGAATTSVSYRGARGYCSTGHRSYGHRSYGHSSYGKRGSGVSVSISVGSSYGTCGRRAGFGYRGHYRPHSYHGRRHFGFGHGYRSFNKSYCGSGVRVYSRSRACYVVVPRTPRVIVGSYSARRGSASLQYRAWQQQISDNGYSTGFEPFDLDPTAPRTGRYEVIYEPLTQADVNDSTPNQTKPRDARIALAQSGVQGTDRGQAVVHDVSHNTNNADAVRATDRTWRLTPAASSQRQAQAPEQASQNDGPISLDHTWALLRDRQARAALLAFGRQATQQPSDVKHKVGYLLAALEAGEYQAAAWSARRAALIDAGAMVTLREPAAALGDDLDGYIDDLANPNSRARRTLSDADAVFLAATLRALAGEFDAASDAAVALLDSGDRQESTRVLARAVEAQRTNTPADGAVGPDGVASTGSGSIEPAGEPVAVIR